MTLKLAALFIAVCASAPAQVAPAATGPGGLPVRGNLSYSMRYSQTAQFGNGYNQQTSSPSASVDYMNGKQRNPFTLNYSGGYTATIDGPSYGSGFFQHMMVTQGLVWRRWDVHFSDDISYLPQAPTTGFSGIPGIGEPIGSTNPTTPSSQTILTLNTHVVNNIANGTIEHTLNYATTFSVGGNYELLRYPHSDGLDTTTVSGNAGLTRRLNARNSLNANYTYFRYTYPGYTVAFTNGAALLGYQRQWSRKISTYVSAGPQWINSNESSVVPASTSAAASATINYKLQFTSAGLNYHHGTNGGAGYLLGAEYDTVAANFSKTFGQDLTIGLAAGYQRTAALNSIGISSSTAAGPNIYGTFSAKFGGVEVTKRIGRNVIVFANYTGTDQSSNSAASANVLNQLMHVIGFGFGYSPREIHQRQ
ncbi:MAG: hypothetical protein P4L10_04505 [Acidobacteriaceae bacterium]|nr:hypothetical protein [Acidobacteriaceae bacterium]